MSPSILQFLDSLICFRWKRPEVIVATPISYAGESGPNPSSLSAGSLEKRFPTDKTNVVFETNPQPQSPEPLPKSNPALLVVAKGQYEIRHSYPFPSLNHDEEVIVQTRAVGLNPIDWKSVDYGFCLPEFPWITGREMAGVVEKVGAGVTHLQVGQRVWTSKIFTEAFKTRLGVEQDLTNRNIKALITKTAGQDASSIM